MYFSYYLRPQKISKLFRFLIIQIALHITQDDAIELEMQPAEINYSKKEKYHYNNLKYQSVPKSKYNVEDAFSKILKKNLF